MRATTFTVTAAAAMLSGLFPLTAVAAAPPTTVHVKAIALDPAISRLGNEELIDRLQEETQRKIDDSHPMALLDRDKNLHSSHLEQYALLWVFLPVDAPARFEENLTSVPRSPAMTELVSRGVDSLPALLQHLTDARPTRVSIHGAFNSGIGFTDNFETRYADLARQPKGVNTMAPAGVNPLAPDESYTLKVGDLCYHVVGQIVNRLISPRASRVGNSHIRDSAISSPVLHPALAAAARADWGGLTAKEHEQSLRSDIRGTRDDGYPGLRWWSELRRLLFYYPEAGREVAESFLRPTWVAAGPAWPTPATNHMTCHDQVELVALLNPVHWEGLEKTLFAVFQAAAEPRPATLPIDAVFDRNELAYACAKRIAGEGHDREIVDFFTKQIEANATAMRDLANNHLRPAFMAENDHYRALLQKLSAGDANHPAVRQD